MKARLFRLPDIRKLMAWVLAGLLLQLVPALAQCPGTDMTEVQRTLQVEGDKSEKFRTGNKPAIAKIVAARAKAGPRNQAADAKLDVELTRRMKEVHDGMPKQIAAITAFRKDMQAATEARNCATLKRAVETWLGLARARIAEYDRYFAYLDDLIRQAGQPQRK